MACSSNDPSGAGERWQRNQGRVNFRSGVSVTVYLAAVRIKLAANLAPRDLHANERYREPQSEVSVRHVRTASPTIPVHTPAARTA